MLALRFYFPAGRYHATPWGRHVNEAAVAWPPEPWRILRALIASWHRHHLADGYSDRVLAELIDALASELPAYWLPPTVHTHTRHYMPDQKGKATLIFDGFARLSPTTPLVIAWRQLALDATLTALLAQLLERLPYLGRAESWVEAEMLTNWSGELNSWPLQADDGPDTAETEGYAGEQVTLLAPQIPAEYAAWRLGVVQGANLGEQKRSRKRDILASLPERLVDALRQDTGTLRRLGWSLPPGARRVSYRRPASALQTSIQTVPLAPPPYRKLTTARFSLSGKPLPPVEDTIRIAEHMRAALMRIADKQFGQSVPAIFSGHGMPLASTHGHAFYLPEDADNDGRIDHVLIHVPIGLQPEHCLILDTVRSLYGRDGQEWRLLLEWIADPLQLKSTSSLLAKGFMFESVTPYLCPWHQKKRFTAADQIQRECRIRGLPEPAIEPLATIQTTRRTLKPVQFQRTRRRKGLTQPDTQGGFWQLRFSEPVSGPLALGFGCHFGLGQFRAVSSESVR